MSKLTVKITRNIRCEQVLNAFLKRAFKELQPKHFLKNGSLLFLKKKVSYHFVATDRQGFLKPLCH